MMYPLFSIVIIFYNSSFFLADTFSILLFQNLDAAKGKYVYFFDSDDSLTQDSFPFFCQMLSEYEDFNLFLSSYETRRKSKWDKLYILSTFYEMKMTFDLLVESLLTKRLYADIWLFLYDCKFLVDSNFRLLPRLSIQEIVMPYKRNL